MRRKPVSAVSIARLAMVLGLVLGSGGVTASRASDANPAVIYRGVSTAVQFDISPPLSDLAQRQPTVAGARDADTGSDRPTGLEGPPGPQDVDALVQYQVGFGEIPAPSIGFDTLNSTGPTPPDPVGAVGPNHYVVMANVQYAVFNKRGTLLVGPANINTLWSGFGGACENENAGDPIVLYDPQADRWLLTQFTAAGPTYFNCVALSQTADPTGAYYRWAFSTGGNFPDYPKYGHWPDAYYISTREFGGSSFAGVGAYALNRAQMIAGDRSPQVISFLVQPGRTPYAIGDGLLPADLDGATLPPRGSPNFYIGSRDNGGPYGAPSDALNIWKFHVDFVNPGNSSFTGPTVVPVAAFDSMFPCSPGSRDCIPQPGTSRKVDHQGYRQRPLHRAAYRNFGTHESIVTNQSVEAAPNISGIRWWEIRSPNSSPTIFQEGTYAPGITDGIHRWMGSIAQDKDGNMALGYSASNTAVFPSVWYAGRLTTDPLGTMGRGELSIINGQGSQTGSARWGDYTAMTVDPVDDCTFWYVNEYYPTTSSTGWRLRVGAFAYPSCTAGGTFFDYTLANSGDITVSPGAAGATTITATLISGTAQSVSFAVSGLPAGATPSFSPGACTPNCSTELTISTSSSTPSGTFPIMVTGSPLKGMTVFNLVVTSSGGCPVTTALQGAVDEQDALAVLYLFRDNVLSRTAAGQRYVDLFYDHAAEAVWLMLRYPDLRSGSRALIERFLPALRAVVAGQPATLTAADLYAINSLLEAFASYAGPGLRADIKALQRDLRKGDILRDLGFTVLRGRLAPRR